MLMCVAADITGPAKHPHHACTKAWKTAEYNYDKRPAIFLVGSSLYQRKKR